MGDNLNDTKEGALQTIGFAISLLSKVEIESIFSTTKTQSQ